MLLLLALQPSLAPANMRGRQEEDRLETRREGGDTDIVTDSILPPDRGHSLAMRESTAAVESLMVQVTLGRGVPAMYRSYCFNLFETHQTSPCR